MMALDIGLWGVFAGFVRSRTVTIYCGGYLLYSGIIILSFLKGVSLVDNVCSLHFLWGAYCRQRLESCF